MIDGNSEISSMKVRMHEFRAASAAKHECDPGLARRVSDDRRSGTAKILMADIIAIIGAYFGLTDNEITSRRHLARIVMARHIAMYFCCVLTPNSYPRISRAFGRHYSTPMYGRKKISMHVTELSTDDDWEIKRYVDDLDAIFRDWQ